MPDNHTAPAIDKSLLAEIDQENDRIDDIRWWDAPVFIVFWLLVITVFLQFFSRYALNSSISWTEEVARYFLIVVAFAGTLICARKNSHIYLDFFHLYLSERVSNAIYRVMNLLTAAFFGYAAWMGITLAQRMGSQRMVSLDISRGYMFWTVTVCLGLTAVITLLNVGRKIKE